MSPHPEPPGPSPVPPDNPEGERGANPAGPPAGDPNDVVIQGHRYDGIREYDNPMPGWWTWVFILSVAWAPVYVLGVHVYGFINDYEADLAATDARLAAVREAYAASGPAFKTDPGALAEHAADPAMAEAGAAVYAANCAACHGDQGQGLIGPNLTDAFWLHGGSPADIYRVTTEGVPAQGMPPWQGPLSDEQRAQVMAYVVSLKGTDPPNPRPPQGDRFDG